MDHFAADLSINWILHVTTNSFTIWVSCSITNSFTYFIIRLLRVTHHLLTQPIIVSFIPFIHRSIHEFIRMLYYLSSIFCIYHHYIWSLVSPNSFTCFLNHQSFHSHIHQLIHTSTPFTCIHLYTNQSIYPSSWLSANFFIHSIHPTICQFWKKVILGRKYLNNSTSQKLLEESSLKNSLKMHFWLHLMNSTSQ